MRLWSLLSPLTRPLRKPVVGFSLAILAMVPIAHGLRELVFQHVLETSLHHLKEVAKSFPPSLSGEVEEYNAEGELLFPLWPIPRGVLSLSTEPNGNAPTDSESESELAEQRGSNGTQRRAGAAPQKKAQRLPPLSQIKDRPLPASVRASEAQVLTWAMQESVPQGIYRPATQAHPAGIELYGVGPLGIGLMDGDLLVTVDGAPVESRSQVIGAVIAARARGAPAMTAGLVRLTREGPKAFQVLVEQPYEEEAALEDEGSLEGEKSP